MKITKELFKDVPKPPRGLQVKYDTTLGILSIRKIRPHSGIKLIIEGVWILMVFVGISVELLYGVLYKFWIWLMSNFNWSELSINRTFFSFLGICISLWAICLLIVNELIKLTLEISPSEINLRGIRKKKWNLENKKSVKVVNSFPLDISDKKEVLIGNLTDDIQEVIINIPSLTDKECVWLNEVLKIISH